MKKYNNCIVAFFAFIFLASIARTPKTTANFLILLNGICGGLIMAYLITLWTNRKGRE